MSKELKTPANNSSKQETYNISYKIRYKFPTNIQIDLPDEIIINSSQDYKQAFADQNINYQWFQDIEQINEQEYVMDIRTKYIVQISYKDVTISKLIYYFKIDTSTAKDILNILQTNTSISKRKDGVKDYCTQISNEELYKKGLNKFIKF